MNSPYIPLPRNRGKYWFRLEQGPTTLAGYKLQDGSLRLVMSRGDQQDMSCVLHPDTVEQVINWFQRAYTARAEGKVADVIQIPTEPKDS